MSRLLLPLVCLLAALPASAQEAPAEIPAKGAIAEVTLYRNQALVSRALKAKAPAGASTLVVSELPEQVVPGSLFATAEGDAEIRAVRFRARAVATSPRADVAAIDAKLETFGDKITDQQAALQLIAKRGAFLDRLETHSLSVTRAELAKGTLNAESLQKLANYVLGERTKLSKEQLAAQRELRVLTRQRELLVRERQSIAAGPQRTVREAVVFVDKKTAGDLALKLSYEVKGVGWRPFYNLRAAATAKTVSLDYQAAIAQASGEDWRGVRLTLSTATPQLRAQGPDLAPFQVVLRQGGAQAGQMQQAYANARKQQQAAQKGILQARGWQAGNRANFELNKWANAADNLSLVSGELLTREAQISEGLSVNYAIKGGVTLASRLEPQLLRIARVDLPASQYHVAAPALSSYVYRHADVNNTSELALLGGQVSVYLDDRFVGHTMMFEVAQGEAFTVGLGTAPRLRVSRQMDKRNERVQGGNKVIELTYKLKLENFEGEKRTLRLLDRIPTSELDDQIKITLGKLATPLSKDKRYLEDERPYGILRWDVEIAGQASGAKAMVLSYGFTLEFDRTRSVSTPAQEKALLERFNEMQQKRYQRRR